MSTLSFMAILLTLASLLGFLNDRWLHLPNTIGILAIALAVSLLLVAVNPLIPGYSLPALSQRLLGAINLPAALLNGALSFLLFAGSLHVDLSALWTGKWTVFALATAGVVIAVALLASGMWFVFRGVGPAVPLSWCVVLGAILAPTDPVAVVGLLERIGLPPRLKATFAGESLFNDGVGVVVFSIALGVAMGDGAMVGPGGILIAFLREAGGGGVLGLLTGWIAMLMMRRIDNYNLELMISLALATGTYSLANGLGLSGPIAVVVAGLTMSSRPGRAAMSDLTHRHLMTFWSLIDEILNAVLFLLIGLEVVSISLHWTDLEAAVIAIPLTLAVRGISVFVPTIFLHWRTPNKLGAWSVLTWGGLRGGISVALALSLPGVGVRGQLLTVCYAIVVFTIIVQGLTVQRVAEHFYGKMEAEVER